MLFSGILIFILHKSYFIVFLSYLYRILSIAIVNSWIFNIRPIIGENNHIIRSFLHLRDTFIYIGFNTKTMSSSSLKSTISEKSTQPPQSLTQKEYYIALRNRLFAVEEQIWLHEYALNHPQSTKVKPLSSKKYNEYLIARGDLLDEYPLTKLYLDLSDAQSNNLTYASMYLNRLISTFQRQLPISMEHVNQIAVLSFQGQVMNLMRGQGLVHQRLSPSNVVVDKGQWRSIIYCCIIIVYSLSRY